MISIKNLPPIKLSAIYLIIMIAVIVALNIDPIAQDPSYHDFADQRSFFGIANFYNVVSNLPFIIIGFIAVKQLLIEGTLKYSATLLSSYLVFFIAIGTVGIGSAYYHTEPTNQSLLWDRLPMTIAFMAFISIIVGEYISKAAAKTLLCPFILIGLSSVFYWSMTEQAGQGDLRFYGLIQFLPMLIIPMILLLFPSSYTQSYYIWAMLASYFVAKIFEAFDLPIFNLIGISGHSIKHMLAAVGPYLFFYAMKSRLENNNE